MANERRVVVVVVVSFLLFSFLLVVTFADFLSSLFFCTHYLTSFFFA